tara:strand:- start:82 stop:2292 length:2211 start_codon:yes stop_codon:yes gene_type:complete
MLNLQMQLLIETFLSKGKAYIASHPELGVPVGIFNTNDEPNYLARVKSIKKLGKKGNPLSLKLAKKLGIETPIPSFLATVPLEVDKGGGIIETINVTDASFKSALANAGYSADSDSGYNSSSGGSFGKIENVMAELSRQKSQADLTMTNALSMFKDLRSFVKAGGVMSKTEDATRLMSKILSLTDQFRKDIVTGIGMDVGFMDEMIEDISFAAEEFRGWALTPNDAMKMLKETAEDTGRAFILPNDALTQAAKLEELYDMDMSNVLSQFDKIGVGSREATETTNKAVATAGRYGATVSQFLPKVADNISKINTYGFKNGVDGLTEMVAQAQVLGFNFESALAAADKAFTPEGAIEMAAQLQMIGGAASELLDPFQLMYMAQNDVKGLQDAIVESTKSAVSFNEATGEFGISPAERLRLKAMADATGTDYENLAETAITSVKRAQAMGEIGAFPGMTQQDKELIASMADIDTGGEFFVKLGTEEIELDDLADRMSKDSTILQKLQKQSQKEMMSLDEVNKAQLSIDEAMAANVAVIQTTLTQAAASGVLGTTSQAFAEALQKSGLGAGLMTGFDASEQVTGPSGAPLSVMDLLANFSELTRNVLEPIPYVGSAFGDSPVQRGRAEFDPNYDYGGAYGGGANEVTPESLENYLLNTPEGKNLLNNYTTNVNNMSVTQPHGTQPQKIDVSFTPLQLNIDGKFVKIDEAQLIKGLTPSLIKYLATQLELLSNPAMNPAAI